MRSVALNLITWAVLVSCALAAESEALRKPQVVSVAELIAKPTAFDGKRVEVEGYWVSGFEWSYLSATPNNTEALPIWLERWITPTNSGRIDLDATRIALESADKKAGFVVRGHSRQYRIRCVGIFSHVTVRRSTPEKPGVGFGHLGAYPSEFRLETILEAKAVALPEDFFPRIPE